MRLMIKLFASGTGSPEHVYGEICTLCVMISCIIIEDVSWKENNVILSGAFNMHIFGVW